MPVVTGALERRGRVKVFVDGEPWAELDAGVAAELGLLREGTLLSDEELAGARVAGERPLAMNRALSLLGYRARARKELEERLLRSGYASGTVEEVLARLEELGYLDDERFARDLARNRKGYGPRRVLGDLGRAGVDKEVARGAVEEEFAGRSEYQEALEIARRRYNTGKDPGGVREARARRVYGFLMRRGYSAGVCAEVARKYRRGAEEE